MGSIILAMLIVVLVGAFVISAVAIGLEGNGRQQHPRIAGTLSRAGHALNGDDEVPSRLQRVFG